MVMLREVEVQAAVHAQLVLDNLVHIAVEPPVQRLDVQVQVVQQGAVVQGAHQLPHHGGGGRGGGAGTAAGVT